MWEELEDLSDEAWSIIYGELADAVAEDFQNVVNGLVGQETQYKAAIQKMREDRDRAECELGSVRADLHEERDKRQRNCAALKKATDDLVQVLQMDDDDEEDSDWD